MSKVEAADKIERALKALGNDPEEVAYSLYRAEVEGKRCSPESCPVAEYLYKECGEDLLKVWVYPVTISCSVYGTFGRVNRELPVAIKQFLLNFDRGCYPHLEDRKKWTDPC